MCITFINWKSSCFYKNNPDIFCYKNSEVTFKDQKKSLSQVIQRAHKLYFGCKIYDKMWHQSLVTIVTVLSGWLKGTHNSLLFAVPMVQHELQSLLDDYYICITIIAAFSNIHDINVYYKKKKYYWYSQCCTPHKNIFTISLYKTRTLKKKIWKFWERPK